MFIQTRQIMIAGAFAATVAAGLAGATLSGETREGGPEAACKAATWPKIPVACLEGEVRVAQRYVSPDDFEKSENVVLARNLVERFQTAFQ